jgi:outer membrane protein assembly factor BamB
MKGFRDLHGDAKGQFADRPGRYINTLQTLADDPRLLSSPLESPAWTTLAGDASRNLRVLEPPGPAFTARPPIRLNAATMIRKPTGRVMSSDEIAHRLAYYPVIAGGQVLIADVAHVAAYDLSSGRLTGRYDLLVDLKRDGIAVELDFNVPAGYRFSLSVADDLIFARLGSPAIVGGRDADNARRESFLVCLALRPDADGRLVRRWRLRAHEHRTQDGTIFEGSPVVHDGRLYVTRIRPAAAHVATSMECYHAATGQRLWSREVCEIRELTDGEPRLHHHVLTVAGPHVVYCSHSGAIVALDTVTGHRVWAVRYPSRETSAGNRAVAVPDLSPCVYAAGRVFAAPVDSDGVFCLDAGTGYELWKSQPLDVAHLLGVSEGKLIVTTRSRPRGIRALQTATGQTIRAWLHPYDITDLPSLGRGLLAGGKVFWPTRYGLYVLDQADGQFDRRDHYYFGHYFGDHLGNMAYGEGCFAIAGAEDLWVYVPSGRAGAVR